MHVLDPVLFKNGKKFDVRLVLWGKGSRAYAAQRRVVYVLVRAGAPWTNRAVSGQIRARLGCIE